MQSEPRIQIENRIRELRDSLNQLEAQLEHIDGQEQRAQHRQIEHLDDYINAVDTRFKSLQLFWTTLKSEWLKPKT
jgi:chromosome segregation ATPase